MTTLYPPALDNPTNPVGTDVLGVTGNKLHTKQHIDLNDAVKALEAKLGIDSSAVNTSLDYHKGLGKYVSHVMFDATNRKQALYVAPWGSDDITGDYATRRGRPDIPYLWPQTAINSLGAEGGVVYLMTDGVRQRNGGSPHWDLVNQPTSGPGGAGKISWGSKRYVKLIGAGGAAESAGQDVPFAGSAATWIRGSVGSSGVHAGLIQPIGGVQQWAVEGVMLENIAANTFAHGLWSKDSYQQAIVRAVQAVNCGGDGIRFTGPGGDSTILHQCVASGCARGYAFVSETPTGSPNNTLLFSCQGERSLTNNFAFIREWGETGGLGLNMINCKSQSGPNANALSVGTDRAGVLIRGIRGMQIINSYDEINAGVHANFAASYYRIRGAAGTGANPEKEWSHDIQLIGGNLMTNNGSATWTANVGKRFDVDNCHKFVATNVVHGGNFITSPDTTSYSTSNPACKLGANTSACEVEFNTVGNGEPPLKDADIVRMVQNAGVGNFGKAWITDRFAGPAPGYKFWGTQPS